MIAEATGQEARRPGQVGVRVSVVGRAGVLGTSLAECWPSLRAGQLVRNHWGEASTGLQTQIPTETLGIGLRKATGECEDKWQHQEDGGDGQCVGWGWGPHPG